jgi:hypothetical protein
LNSKGKQHEINWNKKCIEKFESAFDGKVEVIADFIGNITRNQILKDMPIHPDMKKAID